jgi:hypothetical protein
MTKGLKLPLLPLAVIGPKRHSDLVWSVIDQADDKPLIYRLIPAL